MSRVGVIVVLVCMVILFALLLPVLDWRRRVGLQMQDSAQLREIHAAWMVFGDDGGRFPVPGLIDRLPDPYLGDLEGAGPEASSLNTTANLFSAMIGRGYFNPQLLISPFERNPVVTEDLDHDFSAYDPTKDIYWDPTFVADLETGSNVSYAHIPLVGQYKESLRRPEMAADVAVLGNRGPADGIPTADSYSCRKDGDWSGHFVFNDHHLESVRIAKGMTYTADNHFNFDPGIEGIDQVVAFTKEIKEGKAILQHD